MTKGSFRASQQREVLTSAEQNHFLPVWLAQYRLKNQRAFQRILLERSQCPRIDSSINVINNMANLRPDEMLSLFIYDLWTNTLQVAHDRRGDFFNFINEKWINFSIDNSELTDHIEKITPKFSDIKRWIRYQQMISENTSLSEFDYWVLSVWDTAPYKILARNLPDEFQDGFIPWTEYESRIKNAVRKLRSRGDITIAKKQSIHTKYVERVRRAIDSSINEYGSVETYRHLHLSLDLGTKEIYNSIKELKESGRVVLPSEDIKTLHYKSRRLLSLIPSIIAELEQKGLRWKYGEITHALIATTINQRAKDLNIEPVTTDSIKIHISRYRHLMSLAPTDLKSIAQRIEQDIQHLQKDGTKNAAGLAENLKIPVTQVESALRRMQS